ncbi:MAG: hypothetical protein RIC55_05615 [Pirellulaceae bacterium]
MPHPLEKKIQSVGRLARGQLLLLAGAYVAMAALFAVFLCGLADYLFRWEDIGVRVIISACVLAAVGAAVYWFLWPVLRAKRGDLQVAQRIERRFPQLGDRLSSSLVFLRQPVDEPTAGSPVLRKAVVAEASALTENLDLTGAVDLRWSRRALLTLSYLFRVLLLIGLLNPSASGLAISRMAAPWSEQAWPRRHDLAFVDPPQRIAAGSDFEVRVVDRNGRLPDEVLLEYWYDGDGSESIQSQAMQPAEKAMTLRLTNVHRPFKFRARGGDHDNMPWQALAVVEPPRIESLDVRLVPPAYTALPETASDSAIRAIEGTRVGIRGTVTRPLAAARLRLEGEDEPLAEATIAPDGGEFVFAASSSDAWRIERSGRYWIELVDREGVTAGSDTRWNVTAVPDSPPSVSIQRPGSTTHVMPQALLPLQVVVKDDLALHTVALRYTRSDQSEQQAQQVELYRGPAQAPPADASAPPTGQQRTIDHGFDLSQVVDLAPGTFLELQVVAEDYKPQTGQSTSRRLVIISRDELEDRIARRRASILRRLTEVLNRQRDTRGQTTSLEIQLAETGAFTARDIDQLQSAELNQRQLHERLTAEGDSVRVEIESLLDELESNRIDSPDVNRRMRQLLAIVVRLGDRQMPEIEQQLITALKISRAAIYQGAADADDGNVDDGKADEGKANSAEQDSEEDPTSAAEFQEAAPPVRMALADAGTRQDAVIAELEQLLGELSQWDNYRRFTREFGRLQDEQDEIGAETDRLRIETLGKSPDDLTAQQRAELRKLGQRQFDAARRLDQTLSRMQQMSDELAETDPLAADTLDDAMRAARDLAIGGQMHESGRAVEDNRLGQATDLQREVQQGLEQVLDILSNRREHQLERIVEQLTKASEELEGLRKRQEELQKQMQSAAQLADPAQRERELMRLVKEQQQAAEEMERLSRKLMRLQADDAAQSLAQGAAQGQDAASAAQQDDAEAALESGRQAEQSLEQAEQQLAQQLAQARQELVQEQLVRLEQEIQGLIVRQQAIVVDTMRLNQLAMEQSGLDRAQQSSLIDLARNERELAVETGAMGERLASAAAFQLGLRGAAREMVRAAARLDRQQTDQATQDMENVALERLRQIVAALAPESGDTAEAGGQGGAGQPQEGGNSQQITALAELKLLELLQQVINRRTTEIEAERVRGGLTPELEQELLELAGEQGRLADLMLNLSRPKAENPEDNPDDLPGLSGEDPPGGGATSDNKEVENPNVDENNVDKPAPSDPLLDDLLKGTDLESKDQP